MISGINGSNRIFSSSVKLRAAMGMIKYAKIEKEENGYIIKFYGPSSQWNGSQLILCSANKPNEPWFFKKLPEASIKVSEIGL